MSLCPGRVAGQLDAWNARRGAVPLTWNSNEPSPRSRWISSTAAPLSLSAPGSPEVLVVFQAAPHPHPQHGCPTLHSAIFNSVAASRSWHRVFPRTSVSQEAYLPIPFSSAVVSPYINKRRLLVYVVLGISPPPLPSSHESNSFPPSTTFRAAG